MIKVFRNYLSYCLESLRIGFKCLNEYRVNLYMAFMSHLFFTLTLLGFLFISIDKFAQFSLSFEEVLFFTFYGQAFAMFGYFFRYGSRLDRVLLSGQFNVFLVKPLNVFLQYIFYKNPFYVFFLFVFDFFMVFVVGVYFDLFLDFFGFILCLIFSFFGIIFFILIHRLFDSLAFFFKDFNLFKKPYNYCEKIYHQFPVLIFDGFLKHFGFLVGFSFYGVVPVFWYFGVIGFDELVFYFKLLCLLIFISSGLICLLWNFGLKRYEAFG